MQVNTQVQLEMFSKKLEEQQDRFFLQLEEEDNRFFLQLTTGLDTITAKCLDYKAHSWFWRHNAEKRNGEET